MSNEKHTFCMIVGAGMSGIGMASQLLQQKGLTRDEFRVVDRYEDYGGVWEKNKYPGAACDVPSHAYVLRFHLKSDWSREYARQPEIQSYYSSVAKTYRLREATIFNTDVVSATWNEETLVYHVIVKNNKTGVETKWITNVIINAGGQFTKAKYANIPGMENFKGDQWHTSQWPKNYDFTGKRVAMIGTGPSTAQVAPEIQPLVKELILYQRSATYCVPRNDTPSSWWRKTIFKWFPFLLQFYHMWWYLTIEGRKQMWLSGTKENADAKAFSLMHLKNQVKDPVTRQKLTPTHEFGCKRILVLDTWYPIFNEPNVKLITDVPVKITENSIISKPPQQLSAKKMAKEPSDAYPLEQVPDDAQELETKIDVLIWGTGFDMTNQGSHFQIFGEGGVNLEKFWGNKPKAYYSVGVAKFPNFMMMLGPNAANFWSNLTTLVEIQAKYNVKLIKHIKKQCQKGPYALNVTEKAQAEYNTFIQANMGNIAILSPGCNNYYTNDEGEAVLWGPLRGWTYAWRMRKPNWAHLREISTGHSTKARAANSKHLETVQIAEYHD